eukprot:TRINITY_DN20838_c0_g1_i1.p1 TRINITY_DN20838_c0_g1~~TRINITY_DN20838_c0_g1_i1.p1  ORF type:complete len:357 (-),score=68.07 TRINITY_DN20838_c0_g1_i1:103-1173(-)
MDFDFDIGRCLGASSSGGATVVGIVDEGALRHPRWGESLRTVLDKVGEGSRRAQGLGKAVTYGSGIFGGQRVYLLYSGRTALGLLKTGSKRLYIARGANDGLVEINPTCVLDFYVVEGHQRGGLGRTLFDAMLAKEGVVAERLAYDRPSPKLLGFLRKHFGLARYYPQSNNFVVFDAYFGAPSSRSTRSISGSGIPAGGSSRQSLGGGHGSSSACGASGPRLQSAAVVPGLDGACGSGRPPPVVGAYGGVPQPCPVAAAAVPSARTPSWDGASCSRSSGRRGGEVPLAQAPQQAAAGMPSGGALRRGGTGATATTRSESPLAQAGRSSLRGSSNVSAAALPPSGMAEARARLGLPA